MRPTAKNVAALALVALGGLALPTAPALAGSVHEFQASFGSATSTPADPYPLSGPSGVVVDSAGDVFVADTQNFRVEELDSSGHFVLMFGKEVNATTKGNVCTLASGNTC